MFGVTEPAITWRRVRRAATGLAVQRALLAEVFLTAATLPPADLDGAAAHTFTSMHGIVSATVSGRLWGPVAGMEEQLERSLALADSLVDTWAAAWGLSG